jgi:nicotinate-nucleotide--dimethylbenzimidazole phosphoribosyltransferase
MSITARFNSVPTLDAAAAESARQRQNRLTKPTGSLGRLEDLSIQLAAMTGHPLPQVDPAVVFVFAADHGVARNGVSAYPPEVTAQMVLNYVAGGAVINSLARQMEAKLLVADVGVDYEYPADLPILHRKVRRGTLDWSREPAMTTDETVQALEIGFEIVTAEPDLGIAIVGEMGIGNTATAAALTSALLKIPAANVTGRGTGLDGDALARKKAVVADAVARIPTDAPALDILAEVGGLEIAAMAGAIIGAATRRVPVILDGFISSCAALVAERLAPGVRHYLIASHRSQEGGHTAILESLGIQPLLDLGMRLGEASGGAIALPIVRAAVNVLCNVATFGEAGVSDREA